MRAALALNGLMLLVVGAVLIFQGKTKFAFARCKFDRFYKQINVTTTKRYFF